MTQDLKPYAVYKDCDLPWLEEIPEGWEVRRNGRLFAQRNETGRAELPILEVSLRTGVRVRDFGNGERKQVMADPQKYKRAAQGDIAYNMMRMWQGALGVSPTNGLVSPAYVVARPLPEVEARYYAYLFRTDAYLNEVDKYSRGIVKDRNRLYWEDFKRIPSVYPPREEQAAIVRFLDHADRQIWRAIRAKRKLIALLKEQKAVIIHTAVTRGLNPDAQLKPSGVEWLGDVPEHWGVERVKNLFRLRTEKSGNAHGMELLSIYTHIGVRPRKDLEEKGNKASTTDDYWIVRKRDLIVNKLLAWMGAVGVSEYEGVTSPAYDILMPIRTICPEFYHHLFRTRLYLQQFKQRSRGIMDMRLRLYFDQLGQILVPVPPIIEQSAIVAYYSEATSDLERTIETTNREISLLLELRTRLISDVVIGKLDVREATALLPIEEDTEESIDDMEGSVEDEETLEDVEPEEVEA